MLKIRLSEGVNLKKKEKRKVKKITIRRKN